MTNPIALSIPPVVERELRVASRKPATYWGRAAAGTLGVVVICFIMLAHITSAPLPVIGQFTFRLLGGMAAVTVLVSVLQLASEAFAREKREDTLGLLFLTPLRPVDIVLGKLVSTSLSAFYRFLAIVPVLAVPILAGGVSAGDFALLVLGLVNLVFLGATLGLWVSALCWDEKRAASWASSIMVTLVALPAVVGLGIFSWMGRPGADAIAALSPGFAIWEAVTPRPGSALALAGSLAWTHLLGWIFFYAACRTLPRCWQTRPESRAPKGDHLQPATKRPLASPGTIPSREGTGGRKARRRQFSSQERIALLDRNPLAWFVMRWRPPASSTWAIVVIAVIGYVPAPLGGLNANEWGLLIAPGYALVVVFHVNMAIKVFAAHQASFAFARDRGEDTLDLLLSTPNTARQLIDGHAHALREILRRTVVRALWIEGSWLAITIGIHVSQGGRDVFLYVLGSAAMLGLLVPDVRALAWTAVWQSVVKKNAREAQQETFWSLVVLPWLPVIAAWALGALVNGVSGGVLALIGSWVIASAVADRYYSTQSRDKLERRLAVWATRRSAGEFEDYDGWINLGRALGHWWGSRRNASRQRV